MISNKKEVQILAALMLEKGITDVVISPGSRNAPLINTFASLPDFHCYNVVDERSAAFYALGIALRKQCPVAVACTSGSAMLNYAPAAAEALYQKVPLLILSADRPREWVDQGDGQTIRQENALQNVVKKSISLSGAMRDEAEAWYNTRLINEGLNALMLPESGPVHLNFPFSEPLYELVDSPLPQAKNIQLLGQKKGLAEGEMQHLRQQWLGAQRKMILVGQMPPNPTLEKLLNTMARERNVVILTEKTSNISGEKILSSIDNVLFACDDADLAPDLLITLGAQLVSKKIKAFLRRHKPLHHWYFSPSAEQQDTFMALTEVIAADPVPILKDMPFAPWGDTTFAERWHYLDARTQDLRKRFTQDLDFCDFTVFDELMKAVPSTCTLHLANSTPVRYAQLFTSQARCYQSNRGTSGIDGVMSTAAGYALADKGFNLLLIGDLSFFYDSNALWNQHFPANLKIVLINNSGGGIFRFLSGPAEVPASEEHFVAKHTTSAEALVKNFGLHYDKASNLAAFKRAFNELIECPQAAVLEVLTPSQENAEVLRAYFKYLHDNI